MKPKQLPRLWCALQGLLPFEACRAAELGELAWPGGVGDAGGTDAARAAREWKGEIELRRRVRRGTFAGDGAV